MGILQRIRIPPADPNLTSKENYLASEDLLPVPLHHRTWTTFSYISFWIADSFNVNTFAIAASGIAAGLSWWQALLAVAIGYSIAAPFLIANGRPGAVFHVKFPVVARASFGVWGGLWIVLNRTFMSCIWWSVQAYIGAECVAVLFTAMIPAYGRMSNPFPEKSVITPQTLIGFILFWACSLPTLWWPLQKVKVLFTAKAVIAPIGAFTYLIWNLVEAKGAGPVIHEKAVLQGGKAVFPMIAAIMSAVSNMSTLITNNSDITSMASHPKNALLPQLITLPLGFTITSLIGILIASCGQVIYGTVQWDPIVQLGLKLENDPSHATRFGVAVISISFIYVQLILNLSANSIGFGCDATALLPKYLNIRRGQYLCAFLGILICPWNFFSSSNAFTTYLGAYSVFLSSIAGVMLCEYYLVRKGRYRVTDLYKADGGWYRYYKGFNLRAFAAYVCGIAPNLPGFIGAIGKEASEAASKIYAFNWFVGIAASMGVYYGLNIMWPSEGAFPPGRFQEMDLTEYEDLGFTEARGHQDYTVELNAKPEEAAGSADDDEKKMYGDGATMDVVALTK